MKSILNYTLAIILFFAIHKSSFSQSQNTEKNDNKKELNELRDAYSKTFVSPDGSYTKQQGFLPIHYLDKNNNWKEYGNELSSKNDNLFGIWESNLPLFVDVKSGKSTIITDELTNEKLEFGDNSVLTLTDKNGQIISSENIAQNRSYVLKNNTILLSDVWNNIDRNQNFSLYELETDYIIKKAPSTTLAGGEMIFTEYIKIPNGYKVLKGEGKQIEGDWEGELLVFDTKNKKAATFRKPVYYDNNLSNDKNGRYIKGKFRYSFSDNILVLKTVVKIDWLLAKERVYPVTIDPTVSNTLAQFGSTYYPNVNAGCQQTLAVNVPVGTITGVQTLYSIEALNGAWLSEQRSRVGVGANFSATQNGAGNNNGTFNYNLNGLNIANGAHAGGNVTFIWQGWRTWDVDNLSVCDQFHQRRVHNWIVYVTYTAPTGCNLGLEGASPAQPTGCTPQSTTFGAGAYRDINLTANTYYNFTWTNGPNVTGFCAVPQNGNATGFTTNQTGWFSGTTTVLRVSSNRTNGTAVWSTTSSSLSYQHTTPANVTVSGGGVSCNSPATLTATGGTNGVMYWQNTTNNGTSTATQSTSRNVTANGTYYFRSGNNGCWGNQGVATVNFQTPSVAPTSISGTTAICSGSSTTLTSVGGSLGTGAVDVWYTGSCNEAFDEPWNSQIYAAGATTVNSNNNGILNVTSTSNDPMIFMENIGTFNPNTFRYVNIRYRVTAGTAGNVEIFFTNTACVNACAGQMVSAPLVSDNTWRVVSVPMFTHANWTSSNVRGWRFDWATNPGVTMEIDFISLSADPMIGWGNSITVTPTANTTYFTRKKGNCNNTTCVSQLVTISTPPSAGTLSGNQNICIAGNTSFSSTVSGGSWSSNNTSVATVNASSGAISGISTGTATITYTVTGTGGCPNATATRTVTVTAPPSAGTLSGNQNICVSNTTTFGSTVAGGSWTTSNPAVATVNAATGIITGVAAGSAVMTYTVAGSGGCANATATRTVTVTAAPTAGTLSGNQNVCIGSSSTFSSTASGGSWSSSDGSIASVNALSGLVTGVAAGTATITYTITGTGGCANATATRTVTVTAPPSSGALSGNQNICIGNTSTLSSTVTGGSWTTSNPTVATVNSATGVVTGVAAGSSVMTYTVAGSGGCPNATATRTITVTAPATPGTLSGTQEVCVASTTNFSSTVTGGSWTSSNPAVASVGAASGVVTGVAAGSAVMTYTVSGSGGCPNVTATRTVTVFATPTANAGLNETICQGDTIFSLGGVVGGSATGGTWTSNVGGTFSDANSLNSSWTPGSAYVGTATLTLTTTGMSPCSSVNSTRNIIVAATPTVNAGTGITICEGDTTPALGGSFGGSATGGVWTSNSGGTFINPNSAANANWIPNAGFTGTATLVLTSSGAPNACGTVSSNKTIIVNEKSTAADSISGTDTICNGNSTTLYRNGGSLGTNAIWNWYSGTCGGTLVGTGDSVIINPTTTTTYFLRAQGICGNTICIQKTVFVYQVPVAGAVISPNTNLCIGDSTSLEIFGANGDIQWQYDDAGTWTDIAGATSSNYLTGALTETTTYRVLISRGVCNPVASNLITVIVSQLSVAGNIVTNDTIICQNSIAQLSVVGNVGNLQWQRLDGAIWTNISGATGTSYNTTLLNVNTSYRVIATSGVCSPDISLPITIDVFDFSNAGVASSNLTTICQSENVTLNTTTYLGDLQWQENIGGVWTDITGATNDSYTTPSLNSTTSFRVSAKNGPCNFAFSNIIQINVDNLPVAGNISATDTTICEGSFASMSLLNHSGTIQWQRLSNGTWNNINGANGTTYVALNLTQNTNFRTYVSNGVCDADTSAIFTIIVDPSILPGTVTTNDLTLCSGNSTLLNLTGHAGFIQWEINTGTIWQDIPNQNFDTLEVNNLTVTSSFRVTIYGGTCGTVTSNSVTISVDELSVAGIISSSDDTICANNDVVLSTTSTVGNLQWQENLNGIWTDINAATLNTFNTPILVDTIEYRLLASNGICPTDTSNEITIIVDSIPFVPIVLSQEICGDGILNFNATASSNEVVDWSTNSISIDSTDFSYSSPFLTAPDTFNFFVRTRNQITGCASDWSNVSAISLELLNAPIISDLSFCGTSQVVYSASPSANQQAEWSTDTINISLISNNFDAGIINAPGLDSIYVRYRNTITSCLSPWVLVKANVYSIPTEPVLTDEVLCGNGAITVSSNPPTNHSVEWALDPNGTLTSGVDYTTTPLTAPDTLLLYVRYNNDITGCIGDWGTVNAIASLLLDAGTIGSNQDICADGFPHTFQSFVDATSFGNGGNVTYTWQYSDDCSGVWASIPNSNSANFIENTPYIGQRCYRRLASNNCGTDSSNVVTLFVFAPETALLGGLLSEYCANSPSSQIFALPSNGILSGNGISGNTFTPADANLGIVYITYEFTDGNGCKSITIDSTLVRDLPTVLINTIAANYCSNDPQAVSISGIPSTGTFSGNGVIGNTFSPSIAPIGNNVITYSYTDNNNCTNSTSVNVNIYQAPNPQILGLYDSICTSSPVFDLQVLPVGGVLTGNHSNLQITPDQLNTGIQSYTYLFTDNNGCSEQTTATMWVSQGSFVLANDSTYEVVGGSNIEVNITLNDTGSWNYIELLQTPFEGTFINKSNGLVSYTPAIDYFGLDSLTYIICDDYCDYCDTATIYFNVLREQVAIPTGFSPDGDGINDQFVILGLLERFENNEIIIVNRWGDLVYSAKPYLNDWDGSTNNNKLKLMGNRVIDGTYFYVLKLEEGKDPIKGYIELKRNR
jgi:trimeric autotransporter adhesin